MYNKLAFRNMKRQLQSYLIYFITVAITISLLFAMNNMIYNEDLQQRAANLQTLAGGLLVLSVFLCIIIAFVLGYANAFMLKLRQREFGTYLTLGMQRKKIVQLFLLENSFLGFLALLTGFIFGSLLYQGLMLMMSKLLQFEFAFSMFSAKGILVTFTMVIAIFIVSLFTSSLYLRRVTIMELIHGEKNVTKVKKKPVLAGIIAILSAAAIVYAFAQFSVHLEGIFKNEADSANQLLLAIAILAIAVVTLHFGLAKSFIALLLRSKKIRQYGTIPFVLRQLSASLGSNAILLGLLAFLMTFGIIAVNTGFLYKAVEDENINRRYPFDITGNMDTASESPISLDEAKQKIEAVGDIELFIETPVYTTKEVDFLKLTHWYAEQFTDTDLYIRESDFNQILTALGEKPIQLYNQFAIYSDQAVIHSIDFSQQVVEVAGKDYQLATVENTLPAFVWGYFVIVVPDEVVQNMELVQKAYAFQLADTSFDAIKLNEQLTYQEAYQGIIIQRSDYRIKEYERSSSMAFSSILIVGALYMGFVFILLAMAILALKVLSNIREDEKKYSILYRIGVSKEQQTRTLAMQILAFFTFPIIMPLIVSIPVTFISEKFISLLGFEDQLSMTVLSLLIVCTISLIYFIYYIVTFSITKRYVLK